MKAPSYKHRVTVEFLIEIPLSEYPMHTSHEAAAHIDKLNFTGDTEALLDVLCDAAYSVSVVPVAD